MTIKELIVKFRTNSLTVDELEEMRRQLNVLSLQEIESAMKELAEEEKIESQEVSEELIASVREKLSSEIDRICKSQSELEECYTDRHVKRRFSWRWFGVAAASIVAVIAVGVSVYFSKSAETLLASTGYTEIRTQFGEKSCVILPDGTEVRLQGRSNLRYPSDMAVGERKIEFSGEAYFKVTKSGDRNFSIVADSMVINVKGTEFNVYARPDVDYNEVILDEGEVDLSASNTNYKISLHAGESVIFDKKSGLFDIMSFRKNPALRRRVYGVTYQNVSADSLIRALERTFEVKISSEIRNSISSPFTGTLPDDDLNETLTILSKIYGFNVPYIPEFGKNNK